MNWKLWEWPQQMRELRIEAQLQKSRQEYLSRENERLEDVIANSRVEIPQTKFVLHGYTEAQMRHAFLTAPDSDQHRGVLEQCDLSLMEAVNELVNHADEMTDGQMRQSVGKLRGITELRESFEQREAQARKDQQAAEEEKTEEG